MNICLRTPPFVSRSVVALLALSTLVSTVSGCKPRGESHTLAEIFADARSGYTAVAAGVSPEVGNVLGELVVQLDVLAGEKPAQPGQKVDAAAVAGTLDGLSPKVGVTVRPALAELSNQYRSVAASSEVAGSPVVKLLVARTYSLLSAELRTTRFQQ